MNPRRYAAIRLVGWLALSAGALYGLNRSVGGAPAVGPFLDPVRGALRTASARLPERAEARIPGLGQPVQVLRDQRGVPHIFAAAEADAVAALGYATGQDRLFQIDFMTRVASGRLAEVLGPPAIETDRYLRRTGMDLGARVNARRVAQEGGEEAALLASYLRGLNAYIDGLAPADYPLEYKLLGFAPRRFEPVDVFRLMAYMVFDLTFGTDDAAHELLRRRLRAADYELLYPRHQKDFVPIVHPLSGGKAAQDGIGAARTPTALLEQMAAEAGAARLFLYGAPAEGFLEGKGSNNWAVAGARSATGRPLLAGDMHLRLSLPSIWYEAHLSAPGLNSYGVLIPGTPLPVEAFNDAVAWAFTNTGADVIDHYALELDAAGERYRYNGGWRPLERRPDTLRVKGRAPLVDTLYFSHWGPVVAGAGGAVAIQWVGHQPMRTLRALLGMNRASSVAAFEAALRYWDAPAQNILLAAADGTIAIRSTGRLPIRRQGHGMGLLDGSGDAGRWTGSIPFEALPYERNPERGYLTSTNQQPAPEGYPYYLGHDWRSGFRSLRIDHLLRSRPQHTRADIASYQADVHVVQHDVLLPALRAASGPTPAAEALRRALVGWDGEAVVDRPEPLLFDELLRRLEDLAWDEPVFKLAAKPRSAGPNGPRDHFGVLDLNAPKPSQSRLLHLLTQQPELGWWDIQATPGRENAGGLLARALGAAADTLRRRYGERLDTLRWGTHHRVTFRHLLGSDAVRALGRGPYPYPGFTETLSPASGRDVRHSASWRMVVDFSGGAPQAWGVYPGGQSGDPASRRYDDQIGAYLRYELNPLLRPRSPRDLPPEQVAATLMLNP